MVCRIQRTLNGVATLPLTPRLEAGARIEVRVCCEDAVMRHTADVEGDMLRLAAMEFGARGDYRTAFGLLDEDHE